MKNSSKIAQRNTFGEEEFRHYMNTIIEQSSTPRHPMGAAFQGPQWELETAHSTNPCTTKFFLYRHTYEKAHLVAIP